jgi:hypothetical protein
MALTILLLIAPAALGQTQEKPESVPLGKPRQFPKPQKQQPNWEFFNKKLLPIEGKLCEENGKAVEQLRIKLKKPPQVVLKEVQLTQGGVGEISGDGSTFVLFKPVSPYEADLSCFSSDGKLEWKRTINFPEGADLSHSFTEMVVSNDGRRVALYQFGDDESRNMIGVYDEKGNALPGWRRMSYVHTAPSGRFFFGDDDPFYAGYSLRIFDSLCVPINLDPKVFHVQDTSRFKYSYEYRIFDNDILMLIVTEFKKQNTGGSWLNDRMLYGYDLKKGELLVKESVMLDENVGYRFPIIGRVQCNGRSAAMIVGRGAGKRLLLYTDLISRTADKRPVERQRKVAISTDGSQLMLYGSLGGDFSIVDAKSRRVLKEGSLKRDRATVERFELTDESLRVKFHDAPFSKLISYSASGTIDYELSGWFDNQLAQGLVPTVSDANHSNVDCIRVGLREVR